MNMHERKAGSRAVLLALTLFMVSMGGAGAAVDASGSRLAGDGAVDSPKELHAHHQQHGDEHGHLPAKQNNVDLIGFTDLFAGGEQSGRIADVSAKGNYAYLAVYAEPSCGRGGIQIVDIADPAHPKPAGYIPSHLGTYAGEGSQVLTLETKSFSGDLLVYNNEICAGQEQTGVGGVTLVDVTNPRSPKKLVEGFGDFTVPGKSQTHSNQVHSAFAWMNHETGRAYVIMTDDEDAADTDIIEITNPSRPTFVAEYDFRSHAAQAPRAVRGDQVFIHDEVVKQIDGRYIGLLSYWDGGFIQVDLTDPARVVYLGDTDYPAYDPLLFQSAGVKLSHEGNAHQAEFTRDNRYFVGTDEDFDTHRATGRIVDGPSAGHQLTLEWGSLTPRLTPATQVSGGTRAVGLACDPATIPPADAAHAIAVVERGGCTFHPKIPNVRAAGYSAAIIFNRTGPGGCEAAFASYVEAGIPTLTVPRTDGFRILGASLEGYSCSGAGAGTPAPAIGTAGARIEIGATFDGWGYVHLFDRTTMGAVDSYTVAEGQDPRFAEGFGDLAVHEVATDPDEDLAYLSYYGAGLRVVSTTGGDLQEVGAYVAGDGFVTGDGTPVPHHGNNFWGVEVHKHPNGQKYILASDRDSGLWIFQYRAG